eukprot:6187648-Pleurochrysis_carterae.AAC.6
MLLAGVVVYSSALADVPGAEKDEQRPWRDAFEKAKETVATEAEVQADDESLSIIWQQHGETSERLIAMLLAVDGLFAFRKVMRVRLDSDDISSREHMPSSSRRTVRAPSLVSCSSLPACVADRIFWEQFERVAVGRHKSQYPHAV